MTSSSILKAARAGRGYTQRELAVAAGIPQSRIAEIESGSHETSISRIEQLLAPLGQKLTFIPGSTAPIWETAQDLSDALQGGDERLAWRHFIQMSDDLANAEPATRVALCLAEPNETGDQRFDALIAALADYWLSRNRLPLPVWVGHPDRKLKHAWDVEPILKLQKAARAATPRSIARHGIYLAESELISI